MADGEEAVGSCFGRQMWSRGTECWDEEDYWLMLVSVLAVLFAGGKNK